ncbi:MAG: type II secretion system minor pseudopilin GspI [Pseudomonadota bacterium]
MSRRRQSAQRGMTLVETLVALAILAGVAISAYAMVAQATRFAAAEQERLIAGILADNETVKLMIRQAPPDKGEEEVEIEASSRLWRVKRAVDDFGEGLLRITVTVSRAGDGQVLARVDTLREAS